jgi:hypothetical protein
MVRFHPRASKQVARKFFHAQIEPLPRDVDSAQPREKWPRRKLGPQLASKEPECTSDVSNRLRRRGPWLIYCIDLIPDHVPRSLIYDHKKALSIGVATMKKGQFGNREKKTLGRAFGDQRRDHRGIGKAVDFPGRGLILRSYRYREPILEKRGKFMAAPVCMAWAFRIGFASDWGDMP